MLDFIYFIKNLISLFILRAFLVAHGRLLPKLVTKIWQSLGYDDEPKYQNFLSLPKRSINTQIRIVFQPIQYRDIIKCLPHTTK